jgi:hypothetical protein
VSSVLCRPDLPSFAELAHYWHTKIELRSKFLPSFWKPNHEPQSRKEDPEETKLDVASPVRLGWDSRRQPRGGYHVAVRD